MSGVIVVHAGNRADSADRAEPRFPASSLDRVTASTARLLKALRPSLVVSAPASGADLLVLEQARRLKIAVHVVLPLSTEDFLEASVADGGPDWVARYRRLLSVADRNPRDVVERRDLTGVQDWWYTANEWIVEVGAAAARRARPSESVVALTIRPINSTNPPSVTDDLAVRAAARGWTVLTIDPRPHAADTVGVS